MIIDKSRERSCVRQIKEPNTQLLSSAAFLHPTFLLICVKGAPDAASLQKEPGNKVLMENLVLSASAVGQECRKPWLPLSETC